MIWWGQRKHVRKHVPAPALNEVFDRLRSRCISDVLACDIDIDRLCIDLELVSSKREVAIVALQNILSGSLDDAEELVTECKQALDRQDMEIEVLSDIARLPGGTS